MDFGTRLKKSRIDSRISQEDFAKKIGVTRSSIANYETNRNMPTADILYKIANILNCSIDYLMCKTDIKNIAQDFKLAYYKETQGLTDEEIKQALEFYKMIKEKN